MNHLFQESIIGLGRCPPKHLIAHDKIGPDMAFDSIPRAVNNIKVTQLDSLFKESVCSIRLMQDGYDRVARQNVDGVSLELSA